MNDLGSDVDIVACDREMEELGKCIAERKCSDAVVLRLEDAGKDVRGEHERKNSVTFSTAFEEVFGEAGKSKVEKRCAALNAKMSFSAVLESATRESECQSETFAKSRPEELKATEDQPDAHQILKGTHQIAKSHHAAIKTRRQEPPLAQKSLNARKSHWTTGKAVQRAQTYTHGHSLRSTESEEKYSVYLPSIGVGPSDGILRVSTETVVELIKKQDQFVLLDCRFEYEYEGGHVMNAQNVVTQKSMTALFHALTKGENKNTVVVLYCEYSSVRAPRLAAHLRNEDRMCSTYPFLKLPNVYVMDGGYKAFYRKHAEYCEPRSYRPM